MASLVIRLIFVPEPAASC